MVKIREAIVVEGKYDKNMLSQIVDAPILQTDGFGIFKDKQQLKLLRQIAQKRGLIILTDSDGAGFVIRNYLKGAIQPEMIKHAYIPDIQGKERRKRSPSMEGKLGVEGMDPDVIMESLRRAGATIEGEDSARKPSITKHDLVELGLSGGHDSSMKRAAVLRRLDLPEHMSANALLQVLNLLYDQESLRSIVESL